ncbi:hypothetical protein KIH75_04700 [Bifidobacterium sp. 64T4]|uniref:PspA/IM30 family protein n=1 Tax=Bifidobacterium pongonis TaxID=2834432 RepID=UPI001C58008D|nr:FIVAR domain-containing protein [Bifidobacterium pongonis]MBW3094648.1 hypothetical protein [Bifidobacterium pongonis]
MDEQKFTDDSLNLSFPAAQGRAASADAPEGHQASPIFPGDIVDSSWDFEPLTFPDFAAEAEKGPRHAAPKRNILSALGGDNADSSGTNESENRNTDEEPDSQGNTTVFLPETASQEGTHPFDYMPATPVAVDQRSDRAQASGGEQTVTLPPVSGDAEESQNTSEPEDSGSGSRRSANGKRAEARKKKTIIAIVVLAIVLVAGIGGFMLWKGGQSGKHEDAVAACSQASEQYGKAKKALDAALKSAESAQTITASQVTDATTIEQLKQQVNNAGQFGAAQSCAASRSLTELKNGAKTMETQTAEMNRSAEAIRKAVSSVNVSKTARDFNSLKDAVATAQDLLNSSNGNVSDESVRDALQQAIDAASTLIDGNSTDDKAITDALSALESASSKVQDAMNADSQSTGDDSGTYGTNGTNGTYNSTNGYYYYPNTNQGGTQTTPNSDASNSNSQQNSGNTDASGSNGDTANHPSSGNSAGTGTGTGGSTDSGNTGNGGTGTGNSGTGTGSTGDQGTAQ